MEQHCVNLLERFGERYRIAFDPAYSGKYRTREQLEPWMMVIPCRRGEIYPFSGSRLAVDVEGHRNVRKQLQAIPACQAYQTGDDFGSFVFDAADFDVVAKIVLPRKRRRVSEAQRRRLAQLSAQYGFQTHHSGEQRGPRTHWNVST